VSAFAPVVLPADVVQAAAERANTENRSLVDVATTLLREYAAGKSWVNLPGSSGGLEEAMRDSGLMGQIEESRAHPERMVPLDLDD
jgi:hypothetical protein